MADPSTRSDERRRATLAVAVDLTMLVLILANLTLIVFDWMFLNASFQAFLQAYVPPFYTFYNETIHANFFYIDLAFVAVFIFEIVVRWGIAIARQTYYRWWFYPFAHWYDVLGCVPISSLRTLRLLRVFALIPKVQRIGIVDLKQTYLYSRFATYRDALMEEITDRVIVEMLEGVQDGIQEGNPVTERIIDEVIAPKEEAIMTAFTHRFQEAVAQSYAPRRDDLRSYVENRVADAVEHNEEVNTIARIPGVGKSISSLLERAIADIVFHILDDMLHDVAAPSNNALLTNMTSTSTQALIRPRFDARLGRLLKDATIESLDCVKEQVQIKQWKLEEMAEREAL